MVRLVVFGVFLGLGMNPVLRTGINPNPKVL